MAMPAAFIAGVACWTIGVGCRVIVNTVHGYKEREPARDRAHASRFFLNDEEFKESHLGGADGDIESDANEEVNESVEFDHGSTIPRKIAIYYRMLGGTQRSGISSIVRTMPTTSHWGVQVGDLFYELRRPSESEQSLESSYSASNVVVAREGKNIRLEVVRNRTVVSGSKCIEMGETQYTDSQIINRASYIFQHVYADNFNTWIDNCQSFAMVLCEHLVPKMERHRVRETLESKTMLYPTSAVSLVSSAGYYMIAGVKKDTDDIFSCFKTVSTDNGKERLGRMQERFNRGLDRKLARFDQMYMHPEIINARREFWTGFGNKLTRGYETVTGRELI